jgi:hypothetical protein
MADTTHNTLDCCCYDSNGKSLEAVAGKPSESKKPYKKSGGNKGMAFMQSMFKAYGVVHANVGQNVTPHNLSLGLCLYHFLHTMVS